MARFPIPRYNLPSLGASFVHCCGAPYFLAGLLLLSSLLLAAYVTRPTGAAQPSTQAIASADPSD